MQSGCSRAQGRDADRALKRNRNAAPVNNRDQFNGIKQQNKRTFDTLIGAAGDADAFGHNLIVNLTRTYRSCNNASPPLKRRAVNRVVASYNNLLQAQDFDDFEVLAEVAENIPSEDDEWNEDD